MRRRFGRRGFRKRAPSQWVVSSGGWAQTAGQSTPLLNNAFVMIELVGATAVVAQFDPPIINRFRIETVIGSVHITQSSAGTTGGILCFSWGIGVVRRTTASVPQLNASNPLDAPQAWLYLKHAVGAENTNPGLGTPEDESLPWGSWFRTKTRRVIREDEQLVLSCALNQIAGGASTATYLITPHIRTLITRVA